MVRILKPPAAIIFIAIATVMVQHHLLPTPIPICEVGLLRLDSEMTKGRPALFLLRFVLGARRRVSEL